MIPEDDANRQIANGFLNHYAVDECAGYVATPAGGWTHVLTVFKDNYIKYLYGWDKAYIVLLIDFDNADNRKERCEKDIPEDLKSRVFIIGSRQCPEAAVKAIGKKPEEIGSLLADECSSGQYVVWTNDHFGHNYAERQRLSEAVKDFLFHD